MIIKLLAQVGALILILVTAFFGAFFGAWLQTKYSRKKRFNEILGEKEVEACKEAFTILFHLRRDWLQSDPRKTVEKYTKKHYIWIMENRAFLPSDLYNIFGTINRHMVDVQLSDATIEDRRKAEDNISNLLKKADVILCDVFNKEQFEFVKEQPAKILSR